MLFRKILLVLTALFVLNVASTEVFCQGGWRQWEIRLLDGTSVEASPLQMSSDGKFTRSMDPKEVGYDRSKIDYIAAIALQLPAAPAGKIKQDLVVMLDGKRSFGRVTFKSIKFSEGSIVQNSKEISLKDIAYIKFSRARTIVKRP